MSSLMSWTKILSYSEEYDYGLYYIVAYYSGTYLYFGVKYKLQIRPNFI